MTLELYNVFPETLNYSTYAEAQSLIEDGMYNLVAAFRDAQINAIAGSPNTLFPNIFGVNTNIPIDIERRTFCCMVGQDKIILFTFNSTFSKRGGVLTAVNGSNSSEEWLNLDMYLLTITNTTFTIGPKYTWNENVAYTYKDGLFRNIMVINKKIICFESIYGNGMFRGGGECLNIMYQSNNHFILCEDYDSLIQRVLIDVNNQFIIEKSIGNDITQFTLNNNIIALSYGITDFFNLIYARYVEDINGVVRINTDEYYVCKYFAIKIQVSN